MRQNWNRWWSMLYRDWFACGFSILTTLFVGFNRILRLDKFSREQCSNLIKRDWTSAIEIQYFALFLIIYLIVLNIEICRKILRTTILYFMNECFMLRERNLLLHLTTPFLRTWIILLQYNNVISTISLDPKMCKS